MFFSLITFDDFYALKKALRLRGVAFLISKLKIRNSERVRSQWDNYQSLGSNWWDVDAVRKRWNEKITGDGNTAWEEHFMEKYLKGKGNLSLLSVGCGTGEKELFFAGRPEFKRIAGVDISKEAIGRAKAKANNAGLSIEYMCADFTHPRLHIGTFDVVLFYSSLHHFTNIEKLVTQKVLPHLKPDGLLVMFEYTGSNRFQYKSQQVKEANRSLAIIPELYRKRKDGTLKRVNHPPGLLRMWLNDPSEAPSSEEILSVLRQCMVPLEEKPAGGSILHMLLKDIAHNFQNNSLESLELLSQLFALEDDYYSRTGQSDFWFGVYQKKIAKRFLVEESRKPEMNFRFSFKFTSLNPDGERQ